MIIFFLPVMIVVAVLLFLTNHRPVYFLQPRGGYREKIFAVFKFKTMNDHCDESGNLMPDAVRLTKLGKIIRKASLDELPQLFNVLKGDMSLVGPRPLLVSYLPLYSEAQRQRHNVRPGITGWAQVNGRNAISWQKKFELDQWYVANVSFIVDLKILFLTVLRVFSASNINQDGEVTVSKFTGNN